MDALSRVKARLDVWEDMPSDVWLKEVIQTLIDRVCMRIGVSDLPVSAESLVVDAAVKMVNRRFDEGITSESEGQGGTMGLQFVDDVLAEYDAELSALADMVRAEGTSNLPKVRFL